MVRTALDDVTSIGVVFLVVKSCLSCCEKVTVPKAKPKSKMNCVAVYGQEALRRYEALHEYVPVGEQIRFSHFDCGDTRDRLYVKRVVNEHGYLGTLSYCHNCGEGGGTRESFGIIRPARTTAPSLSIKDALPVDFQPPNQLVMQYLAKYEFTAADATIFGVGWSDHHQRIVLPVKDGFNQPVKGCQLRRVGDYGAKYITMRPTSEPLECIWTMGTARQTVIVEDLLSAWRVWQAGFNAMPLLGNHVRPERLAKLVHEGYKEWVVWLDNDKPEIHDAARYMTNLIRSLGGTAKLCNATNEPKKCDVETTHRHVEETHDRA